MDNVLEELKKRYPCRSMQIEQLHNLYGNKVDPFPRTVYISGGPSTGKTSIPTSLLQKLNVKYAYINLYECYTTKILFEIILNKVSRHVVNNHDSNDEWTNIKCDNLMDFFRDLDKYHSAGIDLNRFVIILDQAEQLRKMDFNLLPAFLRLQELSGYRTSVILISELALQKYYVKLNIVEPIKLHFPQYNKDQLLEIMSCNFHEEVNVAPELQDRLTDDFYKNYINVFLSVFYRACRDLSELKHMARLNFVKYCEPIMGNKKDANDSIGLWRHIAPILKSSLEVLYLRISSVEDNARATSSMQKQFDFSNEKLAQSMELPYYAKYLLIAAYLASYNPAKEDKRLFMKYQVKKRKKANDLRTKSKNSEELNTQLGPKMFSFDRLLAIFYAILEHDKVGFNNYLLVQVSTLVQLRLLTSLSDNYNLDGQKYKCSVNFDFIQTISKMVGFNIRKYLVDFKHM